jgi:uncharacterized protein YcbK (DUF882 family)
MITKQQIARAISFEQYMKQTEQIAHGESHEQLYKDEKMLRYTQDNLERMNRIKRDITIDSKLYNEVQQMTTTANMGMYYRTLVWRCFADCTRVISH